MLHFGVQNEAGADGKSIPGCRVLQQESRNRKVNEKKKKPDAGKLTKLDVLDVTQTT